MDEWKYKEISWKQQKNMGDEITCVLGTAPPVSAVILFMDEIKCTDKEEISKES